MDNLYCDLSDVVITKDIKLTEEDVSVLLCGLTLYRESLERLKSKTEYINKEIKKNKFLKKRLQLLAHEIEKEYDNKE